MNLRVGFSVFVIGAGLLFGASSRADSLAKDLEHLRQFRISQNRLFINCAYCVPNEHEFYVFGEALQGQTGALLSIGTFRTFENASRGEFDETFAMDIDADAVRFNSRHIEMLARYSDPLDFISGFLGEPDLYKHRPEARMFFEKQQFGAAARALLGDRPGRNNSLDLPVVRYIQQILRYCEGATPQNMSFLCDPVRYQRLHKMASAGKIHSVQVDISRDSMTKLVEILNSHGLKIGTLDLSNVADYVPFERLDRFKSNLSKLPFAAQAKIQMTMMPIPGKWSYFVWQPKDFFTALTDLELEGEVYEQLLDHLPKARFLNQCEQLLKQ